MKKYAAIAVMVIGLLTGAQAQILLTGPTGSVSQNFNGYAGTSVSVPAGWTVGFSGTSTFLGTGTGTGNTGGAIAFGSLGEFSFGTLRSGTPGNITLGVTFTNNTGLTINSLTLSWGYEQYRFTNTSGFNVSSTGSLAGNTTIDGKDFVGSATGTNGTVAVTTISSFAVTGLSLAPGSTFGLSWLTTDSVGSDSGVAIDNFSLAYTTASVPEPATGVMFLGGMGILAFFRRRRA